MAYQPKTRATNKNVRSFIENADLSDKKRQDAFQLLDIFSETTGYEAKMWGDSIIGFGLTPLTYSSGETHDWPLVAYSPRKAQFSLYLTCEPLENNELLKNFGKYKTGKSCIYINKLEDINVQVLCKLIEESISLTEKQ